MIALGGCKEVLKLHKGKQVRVRSTEYQCTQCTQCTAKVGTKDSISTEYPNPKRYSVNSRVSRSVLSA
jgi:hypothetical protein